jgi:hypothetical protein
MLVLMVPDSSIHYEVHGRGILVLLFAPCFLSSWIERWRTDPARSDQPRDFLDPIGPLARLSRAHTTRSTVLRCQQLWPVDTTPFRCPLSH